MRLRIRAPSGNHLVNLSDDATISDLFTQITNFTGYLIFDLKAGFPPQPLQLSEFPLDFRLHETGINFNGEQIIVAPRALEDMGVLTVNGEEGKLLNQGQSSSSQQSVTKATTTSSQRSSNIATLSSLSSKDNSQSSGADPEHDPPSATLRNGRMVLRVMPDDNSCLFRALGTAILGNSLDSAIELRSIVTDAIRSQPEVYTEAVLQKAPPEYCRWIMRDSSWGGYIETKAIAEHFGLEVVTLDVKTGLATKFNEAVGGTARQRCFIVYSGIHYDVLAFEPTSSSGWQTAGGGELDQYQFDPADQEAMNAALAVARLLKQRNYYTDTSNFTIKCNDCGWTGEGESEATKHASRTGHMNFVEGS